MDVGRKVYKLAYLLDYASGKRYLQKLKYNDPEDMVLGMNLATKETKKVLDKKLSVC